MEKKFNCIMCPLGCELVVKVTGDTILVTGNGCIRGEQYAKSELKNPVRSVSSLVKLKDGGVVQVKTNGQIPKAKIKECMDFLADITLKSRPNYHEIVVKNICNTGIDIIAID